MITLLWFFIWTFLGIVLHELAHAIAGRRLGLQVAFCGICISTKKPRLQWGTGPVRYFLGWPPVNGLTLVVHDGLRIPKRPFVLAIAAGPLVNLSLLVVGLSLYLTHLLPATVTFPLWVSSAFLCLSLVPMSLGPKGRRLRTDGMLILQILRETEHLGYSAGARIGLHQFLKTLSRNVYSRLGQVASLLTMSLDYLRLGATDRANACLDAAIHLQDHADPAQCLPILTGITSDLLGREVLDPESVPEHSRTEYLLLRAERQLRDLIVVMAEATLESIRDDPQARPVVRSLAEYLVLTRTATPDFILRAQRLLNKRGAAAIGLDERLQLLSKLCEHYFAHEPHAPQLARYLKQLTTDAKRAVRYLEEEDLRHAYLERLFPGRLASYRPKS